MSSRLTVIFYIILSALVGIILALLPWVRLLGLSDWGDNYFLMIAARKLGWQALQYAVSSGWVRGAVTGLGILNLFLAVWAITHFQNTVRELEESSFNNPRTKQNAFQSDKTDYLSDN
jgi:hypothetical protein